MASIGLGQLTALDVTPVEYVKIAGETGCDFVSLFVLQAGDVTEFPCTNRENLAAVKEQISIYGLQVAGVECFMMIPNTDVDTYISYLDLGAELGATRATALLYDADESRVIDNLSRMCELSAQRGMNVGIEYMPLAPNWQTIQKTAELIGKVGKPNLGIAIDLLHLIRSGGTPADVAATDPSLIHYAQLCDSNDLSVNNDYAEEASFTRLTPGEGKFPLQEFLKALPPGTPLELEVPQKSDLSPKDRVQAIVDATRKQIELAGL